METNFFEYAIPGEIEGQDDVFFFLTKTGYESLLEGVPGDLGDLANQLLQTQSNNNALGNTVDDLSEELNTTNNTVSELENTITSLTELTNSLQQQLSQITTLSSVTSQTKDVGINQIVEFDTNLSSLLQGITKRVSTTGNLLQSIGTVDPTNVSTNEDSLIDGDTGNLVYNSSSRGSNNKELPGIDLGTSHQLSSVRIWWWRARYAASSYKIQGSNNLTDWVDISSNYDATGLEGTFQDVNITSVDPYRYVRLYCISGIDANWVVISEMQATSSSESNEITELISKTNLDISEVNNKLVITNTTEYNHTVTVNYINQE